MNQYPYTLQRYHGLPGQYGTLEINALSVHTVEFKLTREYLQLSRDDAQEMIRVLSAWLAAPPVDAQVVHTHGAGSAVVIEDDGPGRPGVVLVDRDRPATPGDRHYDTSVDPIVGARVRRP